VDVLGALCCALAVFTVGAAALPRPAAEPRWQAWRRRRLAAREGELRRAGIDLDPRVMICCELALPVLMGGLLWSPSPPVALTAAAGAALAPRLAVRALAERRRAAGEREAPHLLRLLIANLGAGGTYLEALRAAQAGVRDAGLRDHIATVVQQFLLDVPLDQALRSVRRDITGRNLGMIWDDLGICVGQRLSSERARDLLSDLAASVHHNVQLAGEVRAQTSGQRLQIWILALLVPAIYLYLRLASPYFLSLLDETWTGRLVLLPAAAALEVLGLWLCLRLSRVEV
jgi:Flp pilus assembly protein TadB